MTSPLRNNITVCASAFAQPCTQCAQTPSNRHKPLIVGSIYPIPIHATDKYLPNNWQYISNLIYILLNAHSPTDNCWQHISIIQYRYINYSPIANIVYSIQIFQLFIIFNWTTNILLNIHSLTLRPKGARILTCIPRMFAVYIQLLLP